MEFNWEKFIAAYQAAPEEKKQFIDSVAIAECVQKLVDTGSLSSGNQPLLVTALSHHVLKSTSEEDIIKILSAAGIENVLSLIGKAVGCVEMKLTPPPNAPEVKLQSEIAEVEHEMESLHSLRTMGEDMDHAKQEEKVHVSDQDALLRKESAPAASAQQPADTPRWGSEE